MKHSTLKNIVLPGIFCAACLGLRFGTALFLIIPG